MYVLCVCGPRLAPKFNITMEHDDVRHVNHGKSSLNFPEQTGKFPEHHLKPPLNPIDPALYHHPIPIEPPFTPIKSH